MAIVSGTNKCEPELIGQASQTEPASSLAQRARIPEPASLLLDVIRFSAAIAVVVDHASLANFGISAQDRQMLGFVAVPVFFVLSGFVIRHVTRTRETTLREYLVDRASRIYSVVLPSFFISVMIGGVCFLLNRTAFLRGWAMTFEHPVERLVVNLLFLGQAWGLDTTPFMNVPFWSLGYECAYYLLFGCAYFLRGRTRIVALIVLCLIAGPQVLFLAPVWFLGCLLYDVYQRVRASGALRGLHRWTPGLFFAGLALVAFSHGRFLQLPWSAVEWFSRLPNPVHLTRLPEKHATMLAFAVGLSTAPVLLLLLLAVEPLRIDRQHPWARSVRRIADGTFAVYLLHYPMLVLALFLGLLRPGHNVSNTLVVGLICVLLILLSPLLDRLKKGMRRAMLPRADKATS